MMSVLKFIMKSVIKFSMKPQISNSAINKNVQQYVKEIFGKTLNLLENRYLPQFFQLRIKLMILDLMQKL